VCLNILAPLEFFPMYATHTMHVSLCEPVGKPSEFAGGCQTRDHCPHVKVSWRMDSELAPALSMHSLLARRSFSVSVCDTRPFFSLNKSRLSFTHKSAYSAPILRPASTMTAIVDISVLGLVKMRHKSFLKAYAIIEKRKDRGRCSWVIDALRQTFGPRQYPSFIRLLLLYLLVFSFHERVYWTALNGKDHFPRRDDETAICRRAKRNVAYKSTLRGTPALCST
jgi:hypothetical protein